MTKFKLYYRKFPDGAHGVIHGYARMKEGYAVILIDSRLPEEQQKHTLRHELAHLWLNHFDDTDIGIAAIEAEADRFADEMTQEEFQNLMQWAI